MSNDRDEGTEWLDDFQNRDRLLGCRQQFMAPSGERGRHDDRDGLALRQEPGVAIILQESDASRTCFTDRTSRLDDDVSIAVNGASDQRC